MRYICDDLDDTRPPHAFEVLLAFEALPASEALPAFEAGQVVLDPPAHFQVPVCGSSDDLKLVPYLA